MESVVRFARKMRSGCDPEAMELGLHLAAQLPSGLTDKRDTIRHLASLVRWLNNGAREGAAKRAALEIVLQMPRNKDAASATVKSIETVVSAVFSDDA